MALVRDNIADFVLFPRDQVYPDMPGSRQEDNFTYCQARANEPSQLALSASSCSGWASYEALASCMPDQDPYLDAFSPGVHTTKFAVRNDTPKYTPSASPSTSMSHTFDNPPSILSSASGASAKSTASSAVGSPYSHATHSLHGHDQWTNSQHGLGIAQDPFQQDAFAQDSFPLSAMNNDVIFDHDKFSGNYVGEFREIPSSTVNSGDTMSPSFTSSSASSTSSSHVSAVLATSSPPLALDTSVGASNVTIDTILEEVNSAIGTPTHVMSPESTPALYSPRVTHPFASTESPAIESNAFKSPTTPASAMSPFGPRSTSPFNPRKQGMKRSRSTASEVHRPYPSPPQPPKRRHLYERPIPSPNSPVQPVKAHFPTPFFIQSSGRFVAPLESSYPSLIQPLDTPIAHNLTSGSYPGVIHAFHAPTTAYPPPSPAPSDASSHDSIRTGSQKFKSGVASPYLHSSAYHPYPPASQRRRLSMSPSNSRYSQDSPRSMSIGLDEEGKDRNRCPNPGCGKYFKDLKAHMLTHQSTRPEKCPIATCEYHQKGFARKYDKSRHTLTHYKGTMVCGFCPGSGSAAEKSFNRADVFKRHLTSVHGVEQAPPNSRRRSPASSSQKLSNYSHNGTGKCSTCSATFNNAQDFYEHLDDCVLRVVQQEEPSESVNEQRLAEVANDVDVHETLDRHLLPTEASSAAQAALVTDDYYDDDEEDPKEGTADATWTGSGATTTRSGRGTIKSSKRDYS
ncbi:hypothetical protein MMC09_001533 [Bachmanniomyces sp. S44760]|nr:hypothetical protein [Bachmanniomyces sp. S44760]